LIKFRIGDRVKVPIQAVDIGEGEIIDVCFQTNKMIYLVKVGRYNIWFGEKDLQPIKEEVKFT
jgi:hypothetical protein